MHFTLPPALRHRSYRLLWSGLLVSMAGSQMQLWALFWHIRTITDQPIAVSGIGLVRFVPILIFSLIGGLTADLYNRRRILFLTQTTMALTALSLGLLTLGGQIQLWHIYLITAIQATAVSFDSPARQSIVPNLVPVSDLPSAFSLQSIASSVGAIIGPAMSGFVIAYLAQEYVYFINAISFLAVILALILMGPIPQQAAAAVNGTNKHRFSLQAIADGVRFIRKQPVILGSMLLDFIATLFASANTLMPFVAQDILHVGPVAYGWLSAAQSIGAVGAALVISQRANIRRQGTLLLGAIAAFGLATVFFGLTRTFILAMLALILVGASDAVSTIIRNTVRQMQTPDYIRGRMVSINMIFFMGGPQLGEIEAGLVAQAFGTPAAIVSGGLATLLAVGWIAWRWPQLRRFRGDEPVVAGAPGGG